jgi:hypothetical protein
MKAIPENPRTLAIAPRVIWFEPPERALADPVRFMAYAMTYATHEDMKAIREYVSDDDFREALDRAPPGIIDPRSWAYWNSKLGRYPPPPLPRRRFAEGGSSVVTETILSAGPESSGGNLEEIQRQGREAWVRQRNEQPKEDLEEVRRRARAEWLARFGPEAKK